MMAGMGKYERVRLKEEELEHKYKSRIGKVDLDYSCYSGEDLYCDGPVEDELLAIVKEYSQVEYPGIIEERKSWPILYHLSHIRSNIIDFLPMDKSTKVLELGAGCGAITAGLAGKAGRVDCVELSAKRSQINAYRNQDADNVTIHVGNFTDIEPGLPADYDYVCLIGVFEYAASYIEGDTPYTDLLKSMLLHLKEGGRLVIAIENRLGLKYFAGCREDHLGSFFSGIENYQGDPGVRTFTKSGLERRLKEAGIHDYFFYYPYPDYKFMKTLYSDKRLPLPGELSDNDRNFDRDRMELFHEKYAFDGILEDGLFPLFSNSYLVVTGKELPVSYVRYSNDRAADYAIRTEILDSGEGKKLVRKTALREEAREHILKLESSFEGLKKRYEGSPLHINHCVVNEEKGWAEFPYLEGKTLAQLMDECLEGGNEEGFHNLFEQYVEYISYGEGEGITDYDLAFSNIIVNGDTWSLIDYEWTVPEQIPVKELAFRAIYCYILEEENRNRLLNLDRIIRRLNLTEEEAGSYREKEQRFQSHVTGKRKSMGELRILLGRHIVPVEGLVDSYINSIRKNQIQIYEDMGQGYSEEQSYFYHEPFQGDRMDIELAVSGNVRNLRIDPGMEPCIVRIVKLKWNGEEIRAGRKAVVSNGKRGKDFCYIFDTEDPNINIRLVNLNRLADNKLMLSLERAAVPETMAKAFYK